MQKGKLVAKADPGWLANPVQGRIYLKAALEQGNEQDFLQALHDIMDSLIDSEDCSSELLPLPV